MNNILNDFSDQALTWAIEANFYEFISLLRQYPKAEVHEDPELLWTITDIPCVLFNAQMRARLASETVIPAIQEAIQRSQFHHVPICWYVSLTSQPGDLGTLLEEHGFTKEESQIGMAVELQNINDVLPLLPDLTIKLVDDQKTLQTWCQAATNAFEMPGFIGEAFYDIFLYVGLGSASPVHHYIGYLNGKPVATSTIFRGAGVAGIYNVSTLHEARRQGIGAAMTLRPLQDALQMGYQVGILQASQMGFPVYQKIGFKEYCQIQVYVREVQARV